MSSSMSVAFKSFDPDDAVPGTRKPHPNSFRYGGDLLISNIVFGKRTRTVSTYKEAPHEETPLEGRVRFPARRSKSSRKGKKSRARPDSAVPAAAGPSPEKKVRGISRKAGVSPDMAGSLSSEEETKKVVAAEGLMDLLAQPIIGSDV